jgi:hypothetical protein
VSQPERKDIMTTVERTDRTPEDVQAPLVEVTIDLAPGLRVRLDRCIGDVPLLEIVTGRARLIITFRCGITNAGPRAGYPSARLLRR